MRVEITDGVRSVMGAEVFFCASISTDGRVGARSDGLACGKVGFVGVFCCSEAMAVTTRGRTALLSCALISTAAKRMATTKRARRVRVFIIFRKTYRTKADTRRGATAWG